MSQENQAELTIVQDATISRIALKGRLDSAGVEGLEIKFNAASVASGKSTIVDLSEVTFVASLAIRMLITAAKRLSASGRAMVLLNPQELVDQSLRSLDLYRMIPKASSEQEALDLINAQG